MSEISPVWLYPDSPGAYPDYLVPHEDMGAQEGDDTTATWQDLLREAKAEPTQPDVDANAARWIGQRPAAPLP